MIRLTISLATWLAPSVLSAATIYQAVSLDFPDSKSTFIDALNNSGTAVGYYGTGSTGFGLVYSGGTFTSVEYPGAPGSQLWGINDSGAMVGSEYNPTEQAFEYVSGSFILLNVPDAVTSHASGINDSGIIVGSYVNSANAAHGFVDNGGIFVNLDPPGGAPVNLGISDDGTIVGAYKDANNNFMSFLYQNGNFSPLLCPGAVQTLVDGINLRTDAVVGGCFDAAGTLTPFIYSGGQFTYLSFNLPGPTAPWGISDDGTTIAGTWYDGANYHGFVALQTPEPGTSILLAAGLFTFVLLRWPPMSAATRDARRTLPSKSTARSKG